MNHAKRTRSKERIRSLEGVLSLERVRSKDRIRSGAGQRLRRITAVLFFAAALALACIRSGMIVYALLYMSVLLPLFSAAYTYYVYERMKIVQKIESRAALKNRPVDYVCRLSNETASPFTRISLVPLTGLSELSGFDGDREYRLAPGEVAELRASLICKRRGVYPVGIGRILISDVLGLFVFSFKPPVEYPVTVYPRLLRLETLGLFSLDGSRSRRRSRSFDTEPSDSVRDYVPGDDPRWIHWKSSAHSGTLKVRPAGAEERPSMLIAVDTRRYTGAGGSPSSAGNTVLSPDDVIAREDNLLETLLAICDYCAANNVPAEVYTGGESFIIGSYNDINGLYEWSCRMEFSADAPYPVVPERPFECCAVLTTGHDIPGTDWLFSAASAGSDCVLMEFGSGRDGNGNVASDKGGIRVIVVPDQCDIETILR